MRYWISYISNLKTGVSSPCATENRPEVVVYDLPDTLGFVGRAGDTPPFRLSGSGNQICKRGVLRANQTLKRPGSDLSL